MNPSAHLRAADPAVDLRLLEDLRLHEAELAQQNDSLRAIERQLEEALRRSEALFRAAPVGYLLVDGVTTISRANPAACALLGAPAGSVEGTRLASWVARADRPALDRAVVSTWTREAVAPADLELLRADGATVVVSLQAAPWPDASAPRHCVVSLVDVRARVLAERALAVSERRYRLRFEGAVDGLVIVDPKGRVRALNLEARRLLGLAACDAVGRPAVDLLCPGGPEGLRARLARAPASPAEPFDLALPGGRVAEAHARALDDGGDEWELTLRDVTRARRDAAERDALRRAREEASRLEAIGRVAGGVAHDVNNALAAITGVVEAMLADAPDASRGDLRLIEQAATRARDVTRALLGFARRSQGVRTRFDLNDVVREAGELLRRGAPPGVRVTAVVGAPLPVEAERSEVAQAVANACANALDALGGAGALEIAASAGRAADGRVVARVTVRDDGPGIPAHVLPHVFEPFFSTRLEAGGTGLGLAHVWAVAKRHGGAARVESRPGEGATLTLELPLALGPAAAPTPAPRGPTRRLRVDLVDDDPMPLEATRRLLTVCNCEVRPFLRPAELLAALAEGPLPDALVADVRMPEMSGLDVLARVRAAWPALPVVLVSGEARQDVFDAVAADPLARFVGKPYGRAELDGALRELVPAAAP
ncbi:MAG: ATP-binding protein [Polyangiales bacterium]